MKKNQKPRDYSYIGDTQQGEHEKAVLREDKGREGRRKVELKLKCFKCLRVRGV